MFYKILFTGLFIFFIIACDAPRNNPLDIHNPNREFGRVEGRVFSLSIPHQPLADVHVYSPKDSMLVHTDGYGFFSVNNILPHNDWLQFSKDGYHKDSVFVNWTGENKNILKLT